MARFCHPTKPSLLIWSVSHASAIPFAAFRILSLWQPPSSALDQRVFEQWRQFAVGGDLGPDPGKAPQRPEDPFCCLLRLAASYPCPCGGKSDVPRSTDAKVARPRKRVECAGMLTGFQLSES
jgi:hypothetical protein